MILIRNANIEHRGEKESEKVVQPFEPYASGASETMFYTLFAQY